MNIKSLQASADKAVEALSHVSDRATAVAGSQSWNPWLIWFELKLAALGALFCFTISANAGDAPVSHRPVSPLFDQGFKTHHEAFDHQLELQLKPDVPYYPLEAPLAVGTVVRMNTDCENQLALAQDAIEKLKKLNTALENRVKEL